MTTSEFLQKIQGMDIQLSVRANKLHCSAPEGILSEELRAEISKRKEELIGLLQMSESSAPHPIPTYPRNGPFPLSSAQQRLWFLHNIAPDDTAYHIAATRRVLVDIDLDAFRHSLEKLMDRQEILRVSIRESGGSGMQERQYSELPLQVVQLEKVGQEEFEAAVSRLIEAEARRPFKEGPLWRVTLIQLKPQQWQVIVVLHHIISDGWSIGVFFRELNVLYQARLRNQEPALPELPVQYMDFAKWQQESLRTEPMRQHAEYWSKKLAGVPPLLDLPTDRPRDRMQAARGAVEGFVIGPELSRGLRLLGHQSGTTLFMTLLAAFKVLMYRYTWQTDIVIGTPTANRARTEFEPLIGLFVNTLALRTDLSGDPSVRKLLARIRDTVIEADAHQDLPFEEIVKIVRPGRTLSHSPLFQAAVVLQNTPLALEYETVSAGAVFEICTYFWDKGETIGGSIEYNANLYDASTIRRLIANFKVLLESIISHPDERISCLEILTPEDKRQILEQWNATATEYPRDKTIHELFEERAREHPDKVAIIAPSLEQGGKDTLLTYRELEERSDSLARHITSIHDVDERNIALVLDRSPEFLVAILAILKAGAAYVPIDPLYPKERISFMLQDADVHLLMTTTRFHAVVKPFDRLVICLDSKQKDSGKRRAFRPAGNAGAESLAYVMYTSGSTGTPKGVGILHRNVVRLVKNADYADLSENQVFLAAAPITFDASTFEFWGPLLNGGQVVLYPDPMPTPEKLALLIRRYNVTTLWLTAGLFHLVAETEPECFAPLSQLLAGGDTLSPSHVRKAIDVLKDGVLINGYGPTENTTFTTCFRITKGSDFGKTVPIGRPISNSTVYLLDKNMQPVPIGVIGELWTGGDGLCRGYLNANELNLSRFRPDPFNSSPGRRLYRTGDLARYLSDGTIEFVGRVDNQVKIRGYRVEPGETEQTILSHPDVGEAAVAVRKNSSGACMIGYVVPKPGRELSVPELRHFLASRLPNYMVPDFIETLKRLPLSHNGKVDYGLLPDPKEKQTTVDNPRTYMEARLLLVWEQVLGIGGIGIRDNFFDLGGHSLLAIRLLHEVNTLFEAGLSLNMLFQAQTIEEMAHILSQQNLRPEGVLVTIQPQGTNPPLFLVPGLGGHALGYGELARSLGDDRPIFALESQGLDGLCPPLESIEEIAARFVQQMQKARPRGPYYLSGQCMGGVVAFEIAQQLIATGESVPLLFMIESWPPASAVKPKRVPVMARHLSFLREGISRHLRRMAQIGPRESVRYLRETMRIVREVFLQRDIYRGDRSPLYRKLVEAANLRAFTHYTPKPYPGQIVMILASDRKVAAADDPRLTWVQLAERGCEVISLPGVDSGSLLRKPSVDQLAALISERLEVRKGSGKNASITSAKD